MPQIVKNNVQTRQEEKASVDCVVIKFQEFLGSIWIIRIDFVPADT